MNSSYQTLHARCLQMLIRLCEAGQKEAAWKEALIQAESCPHLLSTLPAALTTAMKARQALNAQQTGSGGKSETY